MSQYNGDAKKQPTPTDPLPISISNFGSNPMSTPTFGPPEKSDDDAQASKAPAQESEKAKAQESEKAKTRKDESEAGAEKKEKTDVEPALPKPPDPFSDLKKLTLSQDFAAALGVKKIITTVPVRKPSRTPRGGRATSAIQSATARSRGRPWATARSRTSMSASPRPFTSRTARWPR